MCSCTKNTRPATAPTSSAATAGCAATGSCCRGCCPGPGMATAPPSVPDSAPCRAGRFSTTCAAAWNPRRCWPCCCGPGWARPSPWPGPWRCWPCCSPSRCWTVSGPGAQTQRRVPAPPPATTRCTARGWHFLRSGLTLAWLPYRGALQPGRHRPHPVAHAGQQAPPAAMERFARGGAQQCNDLRSLYRLCWVSPAAGRRPSPRCCCNGPGYWPWPRRCWPCGWWRRHRLVDQPPAAPAGLRPVRRGAHLLARPGPAHLGVFRRIRRPGRSLAAAGQLSRSRPTPTSRTARRPPIWAWRCSPIWPPTISATWQPASLLTRTAATLAAMDGLERHRGHFYNWYDTRTLQPLPPLLCLHGGQRQPRRPSADAAPRACCELADDRSFDAAHVATACSTPSTCWRTAARRADRATALPLAQVDELRSPTLLGRQRTSSTALAVGASNLVHARSIALTRELPAGASMAMPAYLGCTAPCDASDALATCAIEMLDAALRSIARPTPDSRCAT